MRIDDFLADLEDLLQCEDALTQDTILADREEWDSLAMMSCVAYLGKKLKIKTKIAHYKNVRTVADLIALTRGAVQ